MKTYYSLSACISDIVKGVVAINDVAIIIANTQIPSRDTLPAYAGIIYPGRYNAEVNAAVATLWDSGRIFQATARPTHVRGFSEHHRESTPSEIQFAGGPN